MGQDEHETDAKNRTLTNSASEITNPLELIKKHFRLLNRSVQMSELGFMPKLEHETDAKNRTLTNPASELMNPFGMVKNTFQALESINSDVRARIKA